MSKQTTEEIDNLDKIKSTQVLELIRVAHEFCVFTESIESKDTTEILSFYQKVLPLLYLKGSLIPTVTVSDERFNERYVNEEFWETVFMNFKTKFDKDEYFWIVDANNEPMKASIAEHFADIYQDLKDFVILFQNNRLAAKENAVFEVKKFFAIHWGPRLTAVLPTIHQLLYAKQILSSEEEIDI